MACGGPVPGRMYLLGMATMERPPEPDDLADDNDVADGDEIARHEELAASLVSAQISDLRLAQPAPRSPLVRSGPGSRCPGRVAQQREHHADAQHQ
jgi:hypothetical protein